MTRLPERDLRRIAPEPWSGHPPSERAGFEIPTSGRIDRDRNERGSLSESRAVLPDSQSPRVMGDEPAGRIVRHGSAAVPFAVPVRASADRFGRRRGRGRARAAIAAVPVERDLPVAGADRQAAIRAEGHRGWPGVEEIRQAGFARRSRRPARPRSPTCVRPPHGQTSTVGCKAQVGDPVHGGEHGQNLVGDCIPDLGMVADRGCQQCSLGS